MSYVSCFMSLKLVNAKLWLETGIYEGGLVAEYGAVSKIGKEHRLPGAKTTIDAGGKLVIPGLVDLHVHFREPGQTQKDDFRTGTMAAAAGGVTTVLDEPNNNPVIATANTLSEKLKLIETHAYVDYLLNMAVYADRLDEINAASRIGCSVFAFFDELGDKPTGMSDTGVLYDALRLVGAVGGLALLNCRESDLVVHTIKQLRKAGKNTLRDYNRGFPPVAEAMGAAKRILLAYDVGVRAHLREVSTAMTVDVLRSLKQYMGDVTAEVRPDHLFLNQENTETLGPYSQQWTPIRSKHDQDSLWVALNDGTVDIVASDHATHMVEEKRHGLSNIWNSPPGLPAIESMLPLMLNAVHEGKTSLNRLVEATSVNPAKRLGLFPRKGCIGVGSDADLVVLDLEAEKKITADEMYTKSKWTPYEGWSVIGAPVTTIVRGVPLYMDGEIASEPLGRYIVH